MKGLINKRTIIFLLTIVATSTMVFLYYQDTKTIEPVQAQEGNVYYVSSLGDDTNPGTQALPWKTINKVNNYPGGFQPGDSILFKRGETWREQLIVPSSGTVGNPITFGAYGSGEKPIINGADEVLGVTGDWAEQADGVWRKNIGLAETEIVVFDSTNIGINNATPDALYEWTYDNTSGQLSVFTVAGDNNPATYFISVEAAARTQCVSAAHNANIDYIIIENLELKNTNGNGIVVGLTNDNWIIQDNKVHDCGDLTQIIDDHANLYIYGNNHLIRRNEVYRQYEGHGIFIAGWNGQTNVTVEYNEVYDCRASLIVHEINIGTTSDIVIRYNNVHGAGLDVDNFQGIYVSPYGTGTIANAKVYYNTVSDCFRGIMTARDASVIGLEIYNNVVYNVRSDGFYFEHIGSATIKNNIASGIGRYPFHHVTDSTNSTWDNNNWEAGAGGVIARVDGANYADLSTYKAAVTPNAANDISVGPFFTNPLTNNFTLQPTSPAIDAGIDVGLTKDFEGNIVPQGLAPDIGAYEYQEAEFCPPLDLDCSGAVTLDDLTQLKTLWGQSGKADLNQDNITNVSDFAIMMSTWSN